MAQTTTVTLMPATAAPGTTTIVKVGDKQKAAGYYTAGRDINTITWSLQNSFSGTVKIQASLATTPGVFDWVDVYTITVSPSNVGPAQSGYYNLQGNYVWLRVNISAWSAGSISSIAASY
jgi:hypothetical protein